MKMREQMENLTKTLESMGVEFKQHEGGMVTFQNASGECRVFPSQTYDGLLKVRFSGEGRVGTADAALRLCGVLQ